jgi:integrase
MEKTREDWQEWSPESDLFYAQNRIERACCENRPTLREFADWLGEERALAPATIKSRVGLVCTFVDEITDRVGAACVEVVESLTPASVEDYFVSYGQGHGAASRRSMQASMRLFLRFAASRGWVDVTLAEAVPSSRVYRLSSLPRGLSEEELSKALISPWEKGECPLRDRSIVVLLATYGVRRGQVSALRFEDIVWHEGTVLFRKHKGGKAILHELTPSVAESLADYLRNERPASDCKSVFLRHRPPHTRLSPTAITGLIRRRMERCGLPPRSPHSFRHAFATRLLGSGQGVKAISDLLGHRSLDAVAIYAKVDYARLLGVAIDWPAEVAS